jgi:hypothetical protein
LNDTALALMLNTLERMRDEQDAIKSNLVAINTRLEIIAHYIEEQRACINREALAGGVGQKIEFVHRPGSRLGADPDGGLS